MEKIIQLENKYTREQLYNVLKSKNIGGCSRLKKHDLAKKVIEHKHLFTKPVRRFNQFRFDNSIFSNEKPEQRFNQFKIHQSIFSNDKPEQRYNQFKCDNSIFSTRTKIQSIKKNSSEYL